MRIPLKYKDQDHKFTLLIEVYNPILRLKKKEKEVLLGYLLEYDNFANVQGMTHDQITKELFSTKVRQQLREKIGMSEPSYNNHIHQLKKKGILVEGSLVSLLANIIRQGDLTLEYQLTHG